MSSIVRTAIAGRHYATPERLAVLVGRRLGCRESTAGQLLWGPNALNVRCAHVLTVMRLPEFGAVQERWFKPLHDAKHGVPAEPLTDQLYLAKSTKDAAEDAALTTAMALDNRQSAETLVRHIREEMAASERLVAALCAKWGLS